MFLLFFKVVYKYISLMWYTRKWLYTVLKVYRLHWEDREVRMNRKEKKRSSIKLEGKLQELEEN